MSAEAAGCGLPTTLLCSIRHATAQLACTGARMADARIRFAHCGRCMQMVTSRIGTGIPYRQSAGPRSDGTHECARLAVHAAARQSTCLLGCPCPQQLLAFPVAQYVKRPCVCINFPAARPSPRTGRGGGSWDLDTECSACILSACPVRAVSCMCAVCVRECRAAEWRRTSVADRSRDRHPSPRTPTADR